MAILTLLLQVECNAVTVSDTVAPMKPLAGSRSTEAQAHRRLGLALYPVMAMCNHSCRPAAFLRFRGTAAELVCARCVCASAHGRLAHVPPHPWALPSAMGAGEELTISYGPLEGAQSVVQRRKALRKEYHFWCECPACSESDSAPRGDPHTAAVETELRCADRGCNGLLATAAEGASGGAAATLSCVRCGAQVGFQRIRKLARACLSRVADAVQRVEAAEASGDRAAREAAAAAALTALSDCERRFAPTSSHVASAHDVAARALCAAGRYADALPHAQEALSHARSQGGGALAPAVAREHSKLAQIATAAVMACEDAAHRRRLCSEAAQHCTDALQVARACLSRDSSEVADLERALAACLAASQ